MDDLNASGLSEFTIKAARLYCAPRDEVSALLNFDPCSDGLVFPYPKLNGFPPFYRVKPDRPMMGSDGKQAKYLSRKGAGNRLYIPKALSMVGLQHMKQSLIIVEGEKKALAGVQNGLTCIGLAGVWAWKDREGVIRDFDCLYLKNRNVFICFDSDSQVNLSVRKAEFAFARELRSRGAIVHAIRIPPGHDGTKQGLDDYLLNHSADDLRSLPLDTFSDIEPKAILRSGAQRMKDPWPVIEEAAYHGLLGKFVKSVEPYSEADPVGILLHMLIGSACLIGSGPHFMVEHSPHFARLNAVFVGLTAKGRKGMAWSTPRYILSQVDERWVEARVKSGLSSGEGLIFQVRDPQYEKVPIREGGRRTGEILGYEDRLTDPGEEDKRLLIIEEEFANPLKVMEREGNTLSPVIRDAWNHGNMSPLTKKDRIKATGAHICIIGHITTDELLRHLTVTERGNGFANRILFALVRRSKFIPSGQGAPLSILEPYFTRFSRMLDIARARGRMSRDPEAEALWADVYPKLSEEIPGLTGAILARAEAQVLRLSMIYSLLDEAEEKSENSVVRVPHLIAALAVWDYCKASVRYIFGDAVGNPVADRLLRAIKTGPQTDTDLYEALGKRDGGRKESALDLLLKLGRIHPVRIPTEGRTVTEWHFGDIKHCVLCVERV